MRVFLFWATLLLALSPFGVAAESARTVALTQIVEHPLLDAARRSILDELAAAGFVPGQNLTVDYQNSQSNPVTAAQIARQFTGTRPDVIVAIATHSAQAVAAATRTVLLVFCAVSDPVDAKLVSSLDHPGGNITDACDFPPLAEQLDLTGNCCPPPGDWE